MLRGVVAEKIQPVIQTQSNSQSQPKQDPSSRYRFSSSPSACSEEDNAEKDSQNEVLKSPPENDQENSKNSKKNQVTFNFAPSILSPAPHNLQDWIKYAHKLESMLRKRDLKVARLRKEQDALLVVIKKKDEQMDRQRLDMKLLYGEIKRLKSSEQGFSPVLSIENKKQHSSSTSNTSSAVTQRSPSLLKINSQYLVRRDHLQSRSKELQPQLREELQQRSQNQQQPLQAAPPMLLLQEANVDSSAEFFALSGRKKRVQTLQNQYEQIQQKHKPVPKLRHLDQDNKLKLLNNSSQLSHATLTFRKHLADLSMASLPPSEISQLEGRARSLLPPHLRNAYQRQQEQAQTSSRKNLLVQPYLDPQKFTTNVL